MHGFLWAVHIFWGVGEGTDDNEQSPSCSKLCRVGSCVGLLLLWSPSIWRTWGRERDLRNRLREYTARQLSTTNIDKTQEPNLL